MFFNFNSNVIFTLINIYQWNSKMCFLSLHVVINNKKIEIYVWLIFHKLLNNFWDNGDAH